MKEERVKHTNIETAKPIIGARSQAHTAEMRRSVTLDFGRDDTKSGGGRLRFRGLEAGLVCLLLTRIVLPVGALQTTKPTVESARIALQSAVLPISVDPISGVVHSQRLAAGLPLGGIGTGSYELMTDGTLSHATITGNMDMPTGDLPGCFAAIWTRAGGRTDARVLALKNAYGLPTTARLDFDGLFPQALLAYNDAALPFPITMRAFSPIVPFSVSDSSYPALIFVVRLQNRLPIPAEVSIALSWESSLGVGGTRATGAFHDRTGTTATTIPSGEGFFGMKFTGAPSTAEAVTDADRVRDNANGEITLLSLPPRPQAIVTTSAWNALDSKPDWWADFASEGRIPERRNAQGAEEPLRGREGKTHPAGVVAVSLTLKPNDIIEIPFAVSWYQPHHYLSSGEDAGHYYQRVFSSANSTGRRLLEDWRSLLGLTEEWQQRLTYSNLPRWMVRRFIASTVPLTTSTVHTRDGRFALIGTVGPPLSPHLVLLSSPKQKSISSIPPTALPLPADERTNTPPASATERETVSIATRHHLAASAMLLTLFPQLAAQELAQFSVPLSVGGYALPPGSPDTALSLGPPVPEKPVTPLLAGLLDKKSAKPIAPETQLQLPAAFPGTANRTEDTAVYLLEMTQYTLWTGNTDFLTAHLPAVRNALIALREAANMDGLPTEDREDAKTVRGAVLPSASGVTLYAAALHAGSKLAEIAGDKALAADCERAALRTETAFETQYWNGAYYAEHGTARTAGSIAKPDADGSNSDVCAADQLLGLWIGNQLDRPTSLPATHLTSTLHSLRTRNDAKEKFPYAPPLRTTNDTLLPAMDADLVSLSSSILGDAVVSIWLDEPEAGTALLQRLDGIRANLLRSPWQAPDRFRLDSAGTVEPASVAGLNAAADWNLLYALEGFAYDGTTQRLTIAPNIPGTWRSLTTPIFAPTFWGRLEFTPTAHGSLTNFRLDRMIGLQSTVSSADRPAGQSSKPAGRKRSQSELTLASIRVLGPSLRVGEKNTPGLKYEAHVSRGTRALGARTVFDALGNATITFDTPVVLTAGDRLEIDIH